MSDVFVSALATGFFSELKELGRFPFEVRKLLFWCVLGAFLVVLAAVFSSRAVRALFLRELSAYFLSPIAYVVLTVFVLISSVFFYIYVTRGRFNDVGPIIGTMCFIMIFIAPVITMRLFAEEAKAGTIEVLMTAPITDLQVVLAKYFAAMCFYAFLFAPSIAYPLVLFWLGSPDKGIILSSYIGALLIGSVYVAAGILMSSLTNNQIIAAVAGIILLLLFWVAGFFAPSGTDWVHHTLTYLSLGSHLDAFTKGIVDTRGIVFFVSFAVFFLFLTVRSVESRKWRL